MNVCRVCFPMPQVSSHLDVTIKSCAWISQDCSENVGTTYCAKLYESTTFHGTWHTLLESSWSLVSHPRNGSSFGLPNK